MILYQRGSRVFGTRAVGVLLLVLAVVSLLGAFLSLLVSLFGNNFTGEVLAGMTVSIIQAIGFAWPAAFLLWMYPNIELTKDGINLRYLIFSQKVLRGEIAKIIAKPVSDSYAVQLKKRGLLLNMLYGRFFYGMMDQAVIMLSIDEKDLLFLRKFVEGSTDQGNPSPAG